MNNKTLKVPKKVHDKYLKKTHSTYEEALENLQEYEEKIYTTIHSDKINKKEKQSQVEDLIWQSLEKTMSYVIKQARKIYPDFFDSKSTIVLDDLLYNKDGKNLNERINDWFKEDLDETQLTYHMWLILTTETLQITPRILRAKANFDSTYVSIESHPDDCGTGICAEYDPYEAYPEDEVELPPYHPNCQCEAIYYDISMLEEIP